jgi:hypothetical protein
MELWFTLHCSNIVIVRISSDKCGLNVNMTGGNLEPLCIPHVHTNYSSTELYLYAYMFYFVDD